MRKKIKKKDNKLFNVGDIVSSKKFERGKVIAVGTAGDLMEQGYDEDEMAYESVRYAEYTKKTPAVAVKTEKGTVILPESKVKKETSDEKVC